LGYRCWFCFDPVTREWEFIHFGASALDGWNGSRLLSAVQRAKLQCFPKIRVAEKILQDL
jgi:hypothetical protein